MSSGIEVLVFTSFLFPGLTAGGTSVAAAGAAGAAMSGAAGGVAVAGSSVVTTSAFATGSLAATGGVAGGAATGAAVLGGAVFVVGAAGAALLAAHHLHSSYQEALGNYNQRIENERTQFQSASRTRHEAAGVALLQAQKTRIKAAQLAEFAFLQAGVQRLQKRLDGGPDVDPRLPKACAQLLAALEKPKPDFAELFASYEALSAAVADWAKKSRQGQAEKSSASSSVDLKAAKIALEADLAALSEDISLAPAEVLNAQVRLRLKRALSHVEHLSAEQPHMAEQAFKLLRSRVGRELAKGAESASKKLAERELFAARLRELSGRISARSQATLAALDNEEFSQSPLAMTQLDPLKISALNHLQMLATLLGGELPVDLLPLETLAGEADKLFANTGDQLRQLALQIYLESQVLEVFTQLGYRASMVEDLSLSQSGIIATLDTGHGVEMQWDGTGHLSSELVAFSSSSADVAPHLQEKVCALMDDVFEALRSRGCVVREKKRRHFKQGERKLRIVKAPQRRAVASDQTALPIARRVGE
jgi:hypothetical protein